MSLLAHGGLIGAIAEGFIVVAVTGIFVAIWIRERAARKQDAAAELTKSDE